MDRNVEQDRIWSDVLKMAKELAAMGREIEADARTKDTTTAGLAMGNMMRTAQDAYALLLKLR